MAYTSFKKAFLLLMLCLALLPGKVLAQAESFGDVPVTHPQYEAIEALKEAGILSGYEDGTFKPERVVTRAEMVKMALKGAGIAVQDNPTETNFKDVKPEDWFSPYVAQAVASGIVSGYEDATFRPAQTVNRVEALKLILKSQEISLPTEIRQVYQDIAPDAWYAPYVQLVYDKELLTVQGEEFGRDEGMQRKQVAELLYKLKVLQEIKNLSCWPLKMLLPTVLLWLVLMALNFQSFRRLKVKIRLKQWLFNLLLAPLAALIVAFYQFDLQGLWTGNLRSFLAHRQAILNLLVKFLQKNYVTILYLVLVLLLVHFCLLLTLTSFQTCAYRALWPSL